MNPAEFVRAICERPDDIALRLVFADWLEESGRDPHRATFIRQQCALWGHPKWDRGWSEHAAFRRAHPASAVEPALPAGLRWPAWAYERGFAAHLEVRDAEAFLTHATDIFASSPVTKITFDTSVAEFPLKRILDCTELGRVRALGFKLGRLDTEAITQLAASPNLGRLEKLAFEYGGIAIDGVRALLRSSLAERLTKLNLSNTFGTADRGRLLEVFREVEALPRLRTLKLEHDCLADIREILRPMTGLRELLLGTNRLVREVAPAVARLDLESLDLSNTGLTLAGLRALSEGLSEIRCLRLARNGLGPKAAPVLAAAPGWPKLEWLDIDGNPFGAHGVADILDAPNLRHVPRGEIDAPSNGPLELRQRALQWSRGRN